jgi:3-methyladenine DNA glycosylase/8-oxoguanine DNA glycosylase
VSGNHTPTPWSIEREGGDYTIRGANREFIANDTTYYPEALSEEDAEFIVTAVNSYASSQAEIERLRRALKAILKEAHKGKPDPDKIYATAETALSGSKE